MQRREREFQNADEKRKILGDYKIHVGCVDCGYNVHPWALEFDHKPGTIKVKTVASMMYSSWEVIWSEIDKCEVVCCNCHAIRTFERKQNGPMVELADTRRLERRL